MAEVHDILLDEDDLLIDGGDFVMGESTRQHQRALILDNKGEYKQHSTVGVGAFRYLNDEDPERLMQAITDAFLGDGMENVAVKRNKNTGEVEANGNY